MRAGAIDFHVGRPSLRLILADAFFFAINCLVAMAWITAIAVMAATVIVPLFLICKYLFQIISFCTP
jgi:hypothetical protein